MKRAQDTDFILSPLAQTNLAPESPTGEHPAISCFAFPSILQRILCSSQHFSYWGKFVVRVFGVPRGTWISSQVQLYTAFALSALIHASGDLMVLGGTRVLDGSMPFFAANAFAISIEDALLAAARRVLGKKDGERVTRGVRVLGYVWVIGWMSVLAPMYVRWMFEVGVVMAPVLPFGPLQTIVVPWL